MPNPDGTMTEAEVQAQHEQINEQMDGVEDEIREVELSSSTHPAPQPQLSTEQLLQCFKSDHLPDSIREPAAYCAQLARHMARILPDNPQRVAGLRKLLEAKDFFVGARLADPSPPIAPSTSNA